MKNLMITEKFNFGNYKRKTIFVNNVNYIKKVTGNRYFFIDKNGNSIKYIDDLEFYYNIKEV